MNLTLSILVGVVVIGILVQCIFFQHLEALIMASKAELEAKIAEVGAAIDAGFATLGDTLVAEVQQVIDAINTGGDTSSSIELLEALKVSINDKVAVLNTGISDIIPTAPPSE